MNKLSISFLLFSLLVVWAILNTEMTFGLGLGDLGMLLMLLPLNIIVLLVNFLSKKFQKLRYYLNSLNVLIIKLSIIYYLLSLTIWRGVERPWRGDFFGYGDKELELIYCHDEQNFIKQEQYSEAYPLMELIL